MRSRPAPSSTLIVLDAQAPTARSALERARGRRAPADDFDFEATWRAVRPDDLLTLIYTSGTTGPPKGVQLTHANQLAESRALQAATPWRGAGGGAAVSFLPTAHIADRGLLHYGQMVWGFTITPCPDAAAGVRLRCRGPHRPRSGSGTRGCGRSCGRAWRRGSRPSPTPTAAPR